MLVGRKLGYRNGLAPIILLSVLTGLLAACSSPGKRSMVKKSGTKEYFAESEYGVKASPRVSLKESGLRRGGGRDQVGKPYKVRGKWYYPKEVETYSKVGKASWYGEAFHGRLTANGEVYDMTHLTAAHPTLPLPSYARVTNMDNGNSVIVRINDRGPFAHGRIIDLSKRAAQMLEYTNRGVAQVKVDYIGRAPLDGRDDKFLMASYRPAGRKSHPSDGSATGVMIAMNGSTPEVQAIRPPSIISAAEKLPLLGPILPDRPALSTTQMASHENESVMLAYADTRVAKASRQLEKLAAGQLAADAVVESWRRNFETSGDRSTISLGTFGTLAEAQRIAAAVSKLGAATIEMTYLENNQVFIVTAHPARRDEANFLTLAWSVGATDAMTVRD